MDIKYAGNRTDLDTILPIAQRARPGKPIRVRVQPTIFRDGSYHSWSGVAWRVDCGTLEEASALRQALQAFFEIVDLQGIEQTKVMLEAELDTMGPQAAVAT